MVSGSSMVSTRLKSKLSCQEQHVIDRGSTCNWHLSTCTCQVNLIKHLHLPSEVQNGIFFQEATALDKNSCSRKNPCQVQLLTWHYFFWEQQPDSSIKSRCPTHRIGTNYPCLSDEFVKIKNCRRSHSKPRQTVPI